MPRLQVQPPEWIDSAPTRILETVDVEASPAEVWRRIADHVSWPQWFTALDRVDITGLPTGVGGERRVTARRISFDEVFTAWDEQAHFAFAVTRAPIPILSTMAESVRLDALDTGCRVTYRIGLQGRRGCGPMIRQMARQLRPQLRTALDNLGAATTSAG